MIPSQTTRSRTILPGIIPFSGTLSRKVRIVSPYARTVRCRVREDDAGMEIGDFLQRRFPYRSRKGWEYHLRDNRIVQGEKALQPGERVRSQPPLVFSTSLQTEPSVPDEVTLLDETEDYLLVYKPAPLPVHPGGRYNRNTLTSVLQERQPASQRMVLHRLDSVTSGLVLFGRNARFTKQVGRAFSEGAVEKTYLAIVAGIPANDRITIEEPIRRKTGYLFECGEGGKQAATEFVVLMRGITRTGGQAALVMCRPFTGRTHQIRLHLQAWGHPVIDDPLYGRSPGNRYVQTSENLYRQENDPAKKAGPEPANAGSVLSDSSIDELEIVQSNLFQSNLAQTKVAQSKLADTIMPLQNEGISLLHCTLRIPRIGCEWHLFDYIGCPDEDILSLLKS
ncbi:MAG: RluA family pseudouridine synthase [Cyclonatronaceae bacterium]